MVTNEAQKEKMDAIEMYLAGRKEERENKIKTRNVRDYERKRKRAARRSHHLGLYKVAKGCHNCGYKDNPTALFFYHIKNDRSVKVASAMFNCTIKKLFKEIRKTKLTCANCSSIFTEERRKNRYQCQ